MGRALRSPPLPGHVLWLTLTNLHWPWSVGCSYDMVTAPGIVSLGEPREVTGIVFSRSVLMFSYFLLKLDALAEVPKRMDCTVFVRLVAGANCRFEHSWAFTEPKRSSSKVSITSSYNANKRPRLLVSSPNNPTHYRTGSYIKLARKPNALHALLRRVADIPGWKPRLNKPLRLQRRA